VALKLSKPRSREVEARAWALTQQGWSQRRIAETLDVDQGTVSRAITRVCKKVADGLHEEIRTFLVVTLHQLEHARDEAIQAWERSKKPKRKSSKRSLSSFLDGSEPTEGPGSRTRDQTLVELQEREGEPAYLSAYLAAIDRINSLLHLSDHMKPVAKSDDDGETVTVRDALAEALAADAAYVADPPTPLPIPE
jgi:DNA-binding MarR family transcriptional regulator